MITPNNRYASVEHNQSVEISPNKINSETSARNRKPDFENLKIDRKDYASNVVRLDENSHQEHFSHKILKDLDELSAEIDEDLDLMSSKLRDIVNSELVSLDKIQRMVKES